MLRQLLVFALLLILAPTNSAAQNENVLHFQNLFSAELKMGVACYRIPALVTAKNGDLIAAIDERVPSCADLRDNDDINIVVRRSQDNGRSWSAMESVIDYPKGQSASDPSFILDAVTGDVFLLYNYMDLVKAKGEYRLKMIRSSNHGKSWSEPVDLTAHITKPAWKEDFQFITSGRGIQTKSGKLLHTLVNLRRGLFVFGSDDHGTTWYLIDTPIKPGDESKIMELKDGNWMINSRVAKSGLRFIHTSADEGKTWQTQADSLLIDPACNASLIRYTGVDQSDAGGVLLFSNANDPEQRQNLAIRFSEDEGKSWSAGRTAYAGGAAYSSMTVLHDGSIGLFFEKDGYRENVFVRVALGWVVGDRE
ncbi:MAG: exo-alpha-sialidase [Lewinella sp.]